MAVKLTARRARGARPIRLVARGRVAELGLDPQVLAWARANSFVGEPGRVLLVPDAAGEVSAALVGLPERSEGLDPLFAGVLARTLPAGDWYFDPAPPRPALTTLGMMLGGYTFSRYARRNGAEISLACPAGVKADALERTAEGVFLARDLVNTPANDMGPEAIEKAARQLARRHKAQVSVISGDALLEKNFPMIHAVGRAASEAPRLIDMRWGPKDAPKVTLVGKGVAFDTGGLDIKPSSSMLLMKKDMGGAANVLGLAHMLMAAGLKLRLRVLIPAVENAISASAFRPGDVLTSRKGTTVEIGNTDAEGRLILADALAFGDEEAPELMVDMATLTGAARVALGPELPPFFTDDDKLAAAISAAGASEADPVWRLPLWNGYDNRYASKVADINNVNTDGFGGAIIAALFLRRFVGRAKSWAHFDIFAWSPLDRPHCPTGGEAQAIRALAKVIGDRYPAR
jgi:leucyl aminopeptidase